MALTALPSEQGMIELDWSGEENIVRVCPKDQARFNVHKGRAIQILQLANAAELQLDLLITRIGDWVRKNSDKLSSAFLTLRDERFYFVAVSATSECDDDLEDSASDLDLALANDSDLDQVRTNVIVLPPASQDALNSFLDKRFLTVYRVTRS